MPKDELIAALEKAMPLLDDLQTGRDCEEYAFATGKFFQAMTFIPEAFEALRCLPEAIAALRAYLRERGLIAEEPVEPLLVEARDVYASWCEDRNLPGSARRIRDGEWDETTLMVIALAALRRGMELAERPAKAPKHPVPEGQTPLDDNLRHKYLDVIKQGSEAFDSGAPSPYHGHSLEHCLHAIGWVQRDLRVALDNALARIERFAEQVQP